MENRQMKLETKVCDQYLWETMIELHLSRQ